MRTLGEIVVLTKDGGKPDYDELLYALLALDELAGFDFHFIIELPDEPARLRHLAMWAEESFRRRKAAMETCPEVWLGWNNDPANPDYQKLRQLAIRIADKFIPEQSA